MKRSLRIFTSVSVLGFVFLQSCVTNTNSTNHDSISHPIDRNEVEALLFAAVQYSQRGDFNSLCSEIATMDISCRSEINFAEQAGWYPNSSSPTINETQEIQSKSPDASPVLILKISGERSDGSRYESDFAAVRPSYTSPDDVKIITPVYWSGVKYTASTNGSARP
ncbi:hypothetical protein [Amycolatopsis taiwanensis]|uniref:hypothetical protein n=1 Tax=Amycolatopsis taiwanensis TaxID=342230 RepID=UPI002557BCB7|nr:hypothetical protein [Amycolatopsis taiwanensis]